MNKETISKESEERIKELVIARIKARVSPNLRLSIGGAEALDKKGMIERVNNGDDVGKHIMQAHLSFIRAQASGQLISALNSVK